jgi:hypothetical protein
VAHKATRRTDGSDPADPVCAFNPRSRATDATGGDASRTNEGWPCQTGEKGECKIEVDERRVGAGGGTP